MNDDDAASSIGLGNPLAGGELGTLIREKDWSQTPVGPIETWPQSLRTVVSLCLASNFPINIIWGSNFTQIYNDAYRTGCGDAHPKALGEDYRLTWASAWPVIGESFERACAGETMFLENQRMFLRRLDGGLAETFFTFSHSPIRDETGNIGGLFHPVTETTATMLAERRTRVLRDLATSLGAATSEQDVARRTIAILSRYDPDLPFVLYYRRDEGDGCYRLADYCGVAAGLELTPPVIGAEALSPWPIARVLAADEPVEVDDLADCFGAVACGPYPDAPNVAFVLPLKVPAAQGMPALIVAGASSRLPIDDEYRSFYRLLDVTVANAIGAVRAREDAQRQAEALAEIDRAKTAFFSNVSHEFRTPLTLLLGPVEEALDYLPVGSDEHEQLMIAHRNGLRLLRLVNSLLDFSRVEAGRAQTLFQPIDLAAFTVDLASNFRAACDAAGLALIVNAFPLGEQVYVDRDMWEKIVLNLLSNAFKFTLAGEITVTVTREGPNAVLLVRDTGTGIEEGDLPRIFERFHRVENARGRTHEGTGIGLALARELVTLHGGTIDVSSRLGQGSTFTVRIPFGTAHLSTERIGEEMALAPTALHAMTYVDEATRWLPDLAHVPQARLAEAPANSDDVGQGRILLVDDNADMRDYLRKLLEPRYAVTTAIDGKAALEAVEREAPDLVLSDVMMPRLDGYGLVRALRDRRDTAVTPVILLSARAGEASQVEGLSSGADDYLAKPFSARELLARVAINLEMARVRRQANDALLASEARLRDLNATLESRVTARTAELETTAEALRQSQKMEAVGQLTGGVAHDFNNLLTIIRSSVDFLRRPDLPEERRRRYLDAVSETVDRAAKLTGQLLAFARRQALKPETLNVCERLRAVGDMLDTVTGARVRVAIDLPGRPCFIKADLSQFETALINMAVNARDAMDGEGILTMRLSCGGPMPPIRGHGGGPGPFAKIELRDTGSGIAEANLARIFEPFFTTKEVGKGTGLGLSQVFGFAKQSGGDVDVHSVVGEGTTFTLYLPEVEPEAPQTSNGDTSGPAPGGGGLKVLVVEDNLDVGKFATQILEDLGYRTEWVANAETALERLGAEGDGFDAVFSDVVMPGMGGIALAEELRRRLPRLPVVLASGYSHVLAENSAHGFELLHKPYSADQLSRVLRRVTHAKRGR